MKLLFFVLSVFFVSCEPKSTAGGEVLARVEGETLTKKGLSFLVGEKGGHRDLFSRTMNKWVENKLLYNAALSLGLNKDRELIEKRDLFYQSLLISSFVDLQLKEKIKITKKEVSEYYLKNKESFKRVDDEVLVKHFVFDSEKDAKKLKKELRKKKVSSGFQALLGRSWTETKTIARGGAGSNFVGFVFSEKIGTVVGPKKHNKKHHLFQILQRYEMGSHAGLELVYDEIYQRVYKEKEISVLNTILDSLYLSSDVFVTQGGLF